MGGQFVPPIGFGKTTVTVPFLTGVKILGAFTGVSPFVSLF